MADTREKDFNALLEGYLKEKLNPQELDAFFKLAVLPKNRLLLEQSFENELKSGPTNLSSADQSKDAWAKFHFKIVAGGTPVRSIPSYQRWAAVSVSLLCILGAVYFFSRPRRTIDPITSRSVTKPPSWLKSEHIGATLILTNGDSVILDDTNKGIVAKEDGIVVSQVDGTVTYTGESESQLVNTIRTDRGKLWRLILPDQTSVWLNEKSSITYPLHFDGGVRQVEITGEVYFDVTHQPSFPFEVKTDGQLVEDIGTSFNIDADTGDHRTITTLIEGSVRVKYQDQEALLIPGEQTILSGNKIELTINKNADLDATMAWKNGRFYFRNSSLQTVMKELSDWYNVEVEYQGTEGSEVFSGQIDRSLPLSAVLKGLEQPGIRFILDRNQVTVIQH